MNMLLRIYVSFVIRNNIVITVVQTNKTIIICKDINSIYASINYLNCIIIIVLYLFKLYRKWEVDK